MRRTHALVPHRRPLMRCAVVVLGARLLLACVSTTQSTSAAPIAESEEDTARAIRLAPDLAAQAQLAAQDAARAEGDAADDLELTSELWWQAAIAEADRVELLRARRAHEAAHEAAAQARADLDKQRLVVEAEIRRTEAARIARDEARRMLELATSDELARPGKARELEDARAEVATWLIGRARLLLATAIALGLPQAQAAAAETAIAQAVGQAGGQKKRAQPATLRLSTARDALAASERALGLARAALPGPTDAERDSLLEMAAERKLMPVRDPRGIVFDVSSAFASGTSKLTREGGAQLAQLAAIARAHPHGLIRIEALAPASAPAALRKSRSARAQALAQALAAATTKDRVQLAENPLPDSSRAFVVFIAYATR